MADQHVILAGGGHAHALLIRKLGMTPQHGIRYTLVSPDRFTPYSGMLPGLIAGHYSHDQVHIDLERLCQWAGVNLIKASVDAVDADANKITTSLGQDLSYTLLSLDTGSTPNISVPGVSEFAVPVKPVSSFWQRWQQEFAGASPKSRTAGSGGQTIAVVGGGAGSVEIILAMAWASQHDQAFTGSPSFLLISKTVTILPGYPEKVRTVARQACLDLGVEIHESVTVSRVDSNRLTTDAGAVIETDAVFWCAQASAPRWPGQGGIACNEQGFVKVNNCLQSESHPAIFAAGDIAHMTQSPVPKAGVYAVRQAPFLFDNIQAMLRGESLVRYTPQTRFLSILALGDKRAVGCKGKLSFHGRWAWWFKNRIDHSFMQQFRLLPRKSS